MDSSGGGRERGTGHLKLKLQGALPGLGWAGLGGRGVGEETVAALFRSRAPLGPHAPHTAAGSSRGDGSVLRCVVREYSPKQTLGLGKAFASFSTLSVSPIICIHWVKDLWRVPGPCSAPSGYCSMQQCCSAAALSTLSPRQPVHNEAHLLQLSTASAVQPETGADVSNLPR